MPLQLYGTLPASLQLARPLGAIAAASGPIATHDPGTALGTADVGVFGGGRRESEDGAITTLFRVGALLPTATSGSHAWSRHCSRHREIRFTSCPAPAWGCW